MNKMKNHSTYYINHRDHLAKELFHTTFETLLQASPKFGKELVFLCIGSDRVTGDSLGPFIGHALATYHHLGIKVYGTLEYPVHALNLEETWEYISYAHPDALIVAIDASLGSKKHLGYITLGTGPLYPGAGVRKNLRAVGDIFITGITNMSGALEYLILQTTRLSTVVTMADFISHGVIQVLQSMLLASSCEP